MDENRIEGTIRNAGGKVQEGLGRMTGDAKTQAGLAPVSWRGEGLGSEYLI
jgi:hypothetical protein